MHALSIYGSHDSSICISPHPGDYRIYEFERLTGQRYCSIINNDDFLKYILRVKELIRSEYGIVNYGSCFFAQVPDEKRDILKEVFGFNHFEEISHHAAHAAGAVYQCDFEKCLVISSDSGGHELNPETISTFCIFLADKTKPMNHVIHKIADIPIDLAGAYTLMAVPIREITKEDVYSKYLSYAGKIMGLAAYGRVREPWVGPMIKFYKGPINLESLEKLGQAIALPLGLNTIHSQAGYDLAATSQHVFEVLSMRAFWRYVKEYDLPIVLTGGAALNVILNEKIRKIFKKHVFVPVNPNDCGLSFGMIMLREPAEKTADITYSGIGITDLDKLSDFKDRFEKDNSCRVRQVGIKELAELIYSGKTIGVMRGNSEVGPRALGNRSILCDPSIAGIKYKLNKSIKFREWFRPFAPVVRKQDVNCYFDFSEESRFMSYAVKVSDQYRKYYDDGRAGISAIDAVVHRDNTARVQTILREQNEFLYDLITETGNLTGVYVLLNTSFNIKGKPILTSVEDAFSAWLNSELDCIYIEGWLFEKI